jgi:hypothetical protein
MEMLVFGLFINRVIQGLARSLAGGGDMGLIATQWKPMMPILMGLAAAVIVFIIIDWFIAKVRIRGTGDRVMRFSTADEIDLPDVEVGSEIYKIRLAFKSVGLRVDGFETAALLLTRLGAGAVIAMGIWLLGFPPLTTLAGFVIGWFGLGSFVEGTWSRYRRDIEGEIPTFLSRMSGVIQAEPNVLTSLEEVAATLHTHGALQIWLNRMISQLQSGGKPAIKDVLGEAQAISPALGLATFEIGRLWDTGGEGYVNAFSRASENLMGILDSRAQADAKASGAKSAMKVVIGALVVVTILMLRNSTLAASLRTPLVQMLYLGIAVWVTIGWYQVNSMIEEAVQ